MVGKNVNNIFKNRIINLENRLSKNERYGPQNNVEISGISNEISDQDLAENIIKICKDSGISISDMDIEGCYGLLLGRKANNTTKRVIVKCVNRKHSEAMLQRKKDINIKSKLFVNHLLCPYYQYLWGKCKDLRRKGRINQVFCLEPVVTIRTTENSPAGKILHEKDLMVYQECSWILCKKSFFLYFLFFLDIVNFRIYGDPWSRLLTDYCQLLLNYLVLRALSLLLMNQLVFASSLSCFLSVFTGAVSGTWSASIPAFFRIPFFS